MTAAGPPDASGAPGGVPGAVPPAGASPEAAEPEAAPSPRPSRWDWIGSRRELGRDEDAPRPDTSGPDADAPAPALDGDLRPTARLFLRALGVVYLVAFASLAVQIVGLIGSDGLLPVREFLEAHRGDGVDRLWRYPTLFWLWDGDAAVRAGAIIGLGLSVGLILGLRPKWCLVGLWLLFLSYVTAGRDFFWFQWDSLLLETGALALLLPSRPGVAPHPWVVLLFRWLVFRLLFESGLAKVQQGAQSWATLMAMAWYYETAPLPSLGGWYAHQLPLWAHRTSSAVTLLGELLGPLLVWARGRWLRRAAFALIVGFQIGIALTSNYGYFNLLSAVIAFFLLDARDLRWLPGWVIGPAHAALQPPPARRRPLVAAAAAAIFLLTTLELLVLIAGPGVGASPPLMAVREVTQPFRVANRYHLFAHIDPRRIEPEIEWTVDGQEWRPLYLHYKPGPLERRPPIVAPHQPRLDFQLWFFTLGRDGGRHEYFNTLVAHLCTRPDAVRPWFTPESFPDRPAQIIRVTFHRYRMTDRETLAREGRYWSRETVGYHPVAHFCDAAGKPRF